jgi:flagellar basal body-associated protein FliL
MTKAKKKKDQNAKRKGIMWIIIAIHGFMVVSEK